MLGAFGDSGIEGLGFRLVYNARWTLPNPVGLDDYFEGLCPPYVSGMHKAVKKFVDGNSGPMVLIAQIPQAPGSSQAIKQGVTPYSEELIDCLSEVAQYVYDIYGRFPNTFTTITGFVQAVHLDTDFYDTHYQPGAYLPTHAQHMQRWHSDNP